jgi:Tfp pilus assembly protein PilV
VVHQLRRSANAGRRHQRGVSLIEVLISLTILMIALVGIMPLFLRSMQSNTLGRQYTQSAQVAASRSEEFFTLPLENAQVAVPAGALQLANDRVWRINPTRPADGGKWVDGTLTTAANSGNRFGASSIVRQYSIIDIEDSYQAVLPLSGSTPAPQVHLRELVLSVNSPRQAGIPGVFFPVRPLELTVLRSY